MNNTEILQMIQDTKIIAIARGVQPEDAVKLAEALYAGGVKLLEFTFDMKDPENTNTDKCIEAVAKAMGDKMCVGCGTASYPELVDRAAAVGANYIISADVNVAVIKRAKELGLISIPGAMTASEAMTANAAGADFVKIFPVGNLGADYVKALCGPFGHIKYLAVGGVNAKNITEFLKKGCVGAGVGGNLVSLDLIKNGEFDKITAAAKEYMDAIAGM
ncbi:bifunctional 4-hydroxy-2-oxoglutarate aldolase/2-dehydro-3-deoxy-phosphogluconate aldolase [Chakrabartyella piscis]|uniref:bifunctional 4-hydroxy-2-oxoglutarate aldolase/2-dehydro-3-deoxy-phosphogluconate aldolase n=1 Tax=Chakrabartyella piscis TaxID=2918914 RepID=UPI00295842BF|nr:bifunctional 4-hydroxy-2-oxoglutarate aldolase/2-dehydro-3-deoxy-phosphogluconate aldolase [Chakrabartyella piscis]